MITPERRQAVLFVAHVLAVAAVTVIIELSGGLPNQLVHLYYLPVVVAALRLPLRYSFFVALLAAIAVSPAIDGFHHLIGRDVYFPNPAPWNVESNGWIVRPIAFLAISLLGHAFVKTEQTKKILEATAAAQRGELSVLSSIDRMILDGASEHDALSEIAGLTKFALNAHQAAVVLPAEGDGRMPMVVSATARPELVELAKAGLPADEGVSGWAIQHGKTAVSNSIRGDPRYDAMHEAAQQTGSRAAAAAPVILDGKILGAIGISMQHEHVFSMDEIATLERIADQAAIAVGNARQRDSLRLLSYETAIGLAEAIESRDPYTGDHCSRLSVYATRLASAFNLSQRELEVVTLGAALHDIGKIVVPDEILKKPDKLTPAEFAIVKQHCYQGGQICKRISALRDAFPIVYHHHERWDGRGYPDGLKGEKIPFAARIVATVDAFDAMTSDRPYRDAMADDEARSILRDGAGTQWDPKVIERLLEIEWEFDAQRALIRPAA